MTRDDLLMLVKAGYSKDDINRLFGTPSQAQARAQAPTPTPAQAPTPTPAQAPTPTQTLDNAKTFDDIYKEIVGLRDMVQTNNIINHGIDSVPAEQTAYDALAEILDPEGYAIKK